MLTRFDLQTLSLLLPSREDCPRPGRPLYPALRFVEAIKVPQMDGFKPVHVMWLPDKLLKIFEQYSHSQANDRVPYCCLKICFWNAVGARCPAAHCGGFGKNAKFGFLIIRRA